MSWYFAANWLSFCMASMAADSIAMGWLSLGMAFRTSCT